MRGLLPNAVELVEVEDGREFEGTLLPQEEAAVSRAVEKRRREFAAGRGCARRALAQLGWSEPVAILPGNDRAPLWPEGVVGSITHCDGYCAAAVARRADLASLGIDAEPNRALPPGVEELVGSAAELRRLPEGGPVHWSTLLFCAKEAIFKAWYPLTRQSLDFTDAVVAFDRDGGTFIAQLAPSSPGSRRLDRLEGRFTVTADHLFAAVWAPARGGRDYDSRAAASSARPETPSFS